MKSCWLTKKNRSSCILFFAGWGMDPVPFTSIPVIDHDILMVYDYSQIDISFMENLTTQYKSLHLAAWSMGVWIAGTYLSPYRDNFTSATALNGTLKPIDNEYGIPPKAFTEMIRRFSPKTLEQFYADMFDQPEQSLRFLSSRPARSLESIATELQTLQQSYEEKGPGEDIFTNRIVGIRDRIFQARAQVRSWGKDNCIRMKAGHFPFYDWSSWDQVISGGESGSCD